MSADIGLIGLAVMGENLVLNMVSHGFTVAVYNRTTSKVDDFVGRVDKGSKVWLLFPHIYIFPLFFCLFHCPILFYSWQ